MPIDLPPSVPPHVAHPTGLESRYDRPQTGTVQVHIADQTIQITGNTYLTKKQIEKVANLVDSPAKFIYLLGVLYRAGGHPFVNIQYAREPVSHHIYVIVNQGYLDEIKAPPLLKPFFEPFKNQPDLTPQDFKAAQILAGIKAKRAGVKVSSKFKIRKGLPQAFILDMKTKPDPAHNRLLWTTSFGNPGNRFLGRYFGFTGLQFNAPNGDVLGLTYGRSFTGLGKAHGGKDYNYWQASYSTINTFGLYGVSGSYTHYQLNNQYGFGETQRAKTFTGSMQGSQFLFATKATRWLINEKLKYVDTTTAVTDAPLTQTFPSGLVFPVKGQKTIDERYGVFQLGMTLNHSRLLFGQIATIQLSGDYKRGFAGKINDLAGTNRQTDFNIFAGQMQLIYRLAWKMRFDLLVKGQRSIDKEVPQQEQWVLGGPGKLSAYLPGILIGDTGTYGRFSFRLPVLDLGPFSWGLTLFTEGGTATYADRTGSRSAVRAVADAGVKLEFKIGKWFALSAYHAHSLGTRNFEIYPGRDYIRDRKVDYFFNANITLGF